MSALSPEDLSIVIPTRDRWVILRRTLAALRQQSVSGFKTIVVVDGHDQETPGDLGDVEIVEKVAGGSAAARNAGVARVVTPLTMLLDDDMIPGGDFVERHLAGHRRHPEIEAAVLGRVEWHPELPIDRVSRWLDWSGMMFHYDQLAGLGGADVGWGRFYSCNVSFKTDLFRRVGGFDETFVHYYEDTDLAKRLGEAGLKVFYEPEALTQHLQRFDWTSVAHRFVRVALGERLMARKHPDFQPWFEPMMRDAISNPPATFWPAVADALRDRPGRWRDAARRRAHQVYLHRLAGPYLAAYERGVALGELMDYLGDRYDPLRLIHCGAEVDREAELFDDEVEFYRSSEMYLYDLTAFELSLTKEPYLKAFRSYVPAGAEVLDYGCGIGSDGIALARAGYRPAFADFDNPSTAYLKWRLQRRGIEAPVYDIDRDEIPQFDAVISFDVIEHVDDPFAYLDRLEALGRVVAVNFLEDDPNDTHLHRSLPIRALVDHAARGKLLHYRRYHNGRSHLVVYVGRRGVGPARLRSSLEHAVGRVASKLARTE